ncbi:hypothetical protein DENSPDRAFT_851845 [Dentipellis sp. KUC8613]|nr:hypothetical protein DENSPDRAFT_851845 [Dentipellis sp. KUC8613]
MYQRDEGKTVAASGWEGRRQVSPFVRSVDLWTDAPARPLDQHLAPAPSTRLLQLFKHQGSYVAWHEQQQVMQQKSHKITRNASQGIVRDRVVTRSYSKTNASSPGAGLSHASESGMTDPGMPPSYLAPGMQSMHNASYFPPSTSHSFPHDEQAGPVTSTSAAASHAMIPTPSVHSAILNDAYLAIHARAEKAAQAALFMRSKRPSTDQERRRKRADKSQRKRGRDVDNRAALNNFLPESKRVMSDPPGLVEVIRKVLEVD